MITDPANLAIPSTFGSSLVYTLATAVAALGTSTLLFPALRSFLSPAPPTNRFSHRIPITRVDMDGTILHKKGQVSRLYHLQGIDPTVTHLEDREADAMSKQYWLVALNNGATTARLFLRNSPSGLPPAPTPPHQMIAVLAKRHHDSLAPVYNPSNVVILTTRAGGAEALITMEEAEARLMGHLSRYRPKRLTQHEGEALGFFAKFTSPIQRPRPAGPGTDMAAICTDGIQINFPKRYIRFTNGDKTTYMGVWTLSTLGAEMSPGLSSDILAIDASVVLMQSINVHTKAQSNNKLARKKKFGTSSDSKLVNKILDDAADSIKAEVNPDCTGDFAWVLFAYGDTPEHLDAIHIKIITAMGSTGFTPIREGAFLRRAYESIFPPNPITTTPRLLFGSQAAQALAMVESAPGLKRSQWLPRPFCYLKTPTRQLYPWNWHVTHQDNNPVAHGTCVGRTGLGKSARMLYLAQLTLQNPDLQVFWWDNYNAAYAATKALGPLAQYISISSDPNEAYLNPCQLPDNPENRQHLRYLLSLITAGHLESTDDLPPTLSRQIDDAVAINFHPATPLALRNFVELQKVAFPPPIDGTDEQRGMAYLALNRWISANAGYLCAKRDQIALSGARWFTFDYETVKDDPKAAALVSADLMHRVFQSLRRQRRPTLVVIDEAPNILQIKMMLKWFEICHAQIRRLDGAIWSLWQTPKQMEDVGATSIIRQNALTRVILPDEKADEAEYRDILGFSGIHLDIITKRHAVTHNFAYPTLIDRPDHSVLVNMDLSPIGDKGLRVYAGSDGANALKDLEQQYPDAEAYRQYLSLKTIRKAQK